MSIAVVTDSTAYVPDEVVSRVRLHIVPLTVSLPGRDGRDGVDVSPEDVARALSERRANVTTSRPAPAEFAKAYQELLEAGATGIVSVHLSARLSGTFESATLAAAEFGDRVAVVDTASAGMAVGFAAIAAAEASAGGAGIDVVREAAAVASRRTSTLFYVDTLEFLRRGGRISAASAFVGTALSVKPILHVLDGEVVLKEKVRTSARALGRMADLAVEAADGAHIDVAVQHLAALDRARSLHEALVERLGDRVRQAYLLDVGAVLAAHTGPGVIGVVVHRRPPQPATSES